MRWIVRLALGAVLAALSVSTQTEAAALAEKAAASRSFEYAVLHRADRGTARVIVKTAGSDKPRRVLFKAEGHRALANPDGRGRWVLTRSTTDGRRLVAAMRRELDAGARLVRLHVAGRYGCGARLKVLFKIRDINRRDKHPEVKERRESGCA